MVSTGTQCCLISAPPLGLQNIAANHEARPGQVDTHNGHEDSSDDDYDEMPVDDDDYSPSDNDPDDAIIIQPRIRYFFFLAMIVKLCCTCTRI